MMPLTIGLNDCYWSFILKADALGIVSINTVTFACCKLYFWQDFALKMTPALLYFSSSLISCYIL